MSKLGLRHYFILTMLSATLVACSSPSTPIVDPMTGDLEIAAAVSSAPQNLVPGETLYVSSDRLRARSSPSVQDNNIVEVLALGDKVVVRKILEKGSEFVGISVESLGPATVVYVGQAYLSRKKTNANLFIIQNIATERSRVYKNCGGQFCAHELLLETENVVGDDTAEKRTLLGSFKVTQWFKFYEDNESKYPSWYHPNYVLPPLATDPISSWFDRAFLPTRRGGQTRGEIRGGFGWYAAYVGPDASAQWIHGTYGWGANKKDFIQKTRSHGCTRFDNESVAYLRHLIATGTPVARIYAKEELKTQTLQKEPGQWRYILTKDDAQSSTHYESDRDEVIRRGVEKSRWLEEGTYTVNKNATAIHLRQNSTDGGSTIHDNGNAYGIPESSFVGTYWVDLGRVENYQHPRELEVGGYKDHLIPHSMILSHE